MKHMYIKMTEDEFTEANQYGLWEFEQKLRNYALELLSEAKKEQKYGSRKQY